MRIQPSRRVSRIVFRLVWSAWLLAGLAAFLGWIEWRDATLVTFILIPVSRYCASSAADDDGRPADESTG